MDQAQFAREELRSYALRRCIRFYSAVLLVFLVAWSSQMVGDRESAHEMFLLGAVLFGALTLVEAASGAVMVPMARLRGPGPENGLWRFAQGPGPSVVAGALWAGIAAVFLLASRV